MKAVAWAIIIGSTAAVSCGDGGSTTAKETPADSQRVAEHVDPSTQFPRQIAETDTLQTDVNFVDNAIQSGEETIRLTSLAVDKASRAEVKKIAQQIAADQRQWLTEWRRRQKSKTAGDSTKNFTDGGREALEKLAGAAFDRQWVEKMVTRNAAGISRYEIESGATKDKDIKKTIDNVLPKLKDHQQQLEALRTKLQ